MTASDRLSAGALIAGSCDARVIHRPGRFSARLVSLSWEQERQPENSAICPQSLLLLIPSHHRILLFRLLDLKSIRLRTDIIARELVHSDRCMESEKESGYRRVRGAEVRFVSPSMHSRCVPRPGVYWSDRPRTSGGRGRADTAQQQSWQGKARQEGRSMCVAVKHITESRTPRRERCGDVRGQWP